jgi:myotubularin-related protein 9
VQMLNTAIEVVEHKPGSQTMLLVLKDFRQVLLEFPLPEEALDLADALRALSRPRQLSQLYAFSQQPSPPLPRPPPAWEVSSSAQLLERWYCSTQRWRITHINKGFKVCSSYPEEAIVPSSVSDERLSHVVKFRQNGRFPVLAYHHQKTQAVIVRCGQPQVGPGQRNRSKEDEQLLNACLPSLSKGKVLDTRPQEVVTAHMSKGGGVELPAHYPQWRVEYGKMESRAGLAASLVRLREACADSASVSWWSRVEASGWLTNVTRLLSCAKFVALCVHRDAASVVVHGAAGLDAALQISSLAQIFLDPHTRTMAGFAELIQREWLEAGHPFSLRHGHTSLVPEKDRSPTFLLFLDAVWQVMQQFPLSFEFTDQFLHLLLTHSYTSEFGTFLYDTPQERRRHRHKTHCLWAHLAQPNVAKPLTNPLYDRNSSVLVLSVSHLTVSLWQGLYIRGGLESAISLPGLEAKQRLREKNRELQEKLADTRAQLSSLQATVRARLNSQDAKYLDIL